MTRLRLGISEPPKRLWVILILALLLITATACRQGQVASAIEADIWLIDQLPSSLCQDGSPLWSEGIYRKVACTKDSSVRECTQGAKEYEEFVSYCSRQVRKYMAMHADDKKEWADWASKHCR